MVLGNATRLKKSKILAFLLGCIVIFQSGHAFQTIIPSLQLLIYVSLMLAMVFMVFDREWLNFIKVQNFALVIFVFMIATTMINSRGSGLNYYLQMFSIVLSAYFIVRIYSFDEFASFYLKLMTVVSLVALIGYILLQTTPLLSYLPEMENINGVQYGVAGIFNYIVDVPDRNCGMFWEPGLFATYLSFAMVFELITKEKSSVLRMILFTIGIFTANSSAGFVLCFLCFLFLFVRKNNKRLGAVKGAISLLVLIVGVAIIANFDTILAETALGENEYFQKLSTDSVLESSRSNAIFHNLDTFFSNPVFGVGYTVAMKNIAYVADTSTSTFLMSVFGFLGIFYTVFIVYGVLKIRNLNIFSKILLLAVILIIVNKEPHHQIVFTWILIFYLLKGIEIGNASGVQGESNAEVFGGEK